MNLSEQNVLLFPRTMQVGGTENVVIQLCEILLTRVNKVVVCSCGGVNVARLEKMGVKHFLIPDIENKSLGNIINVFREISRIIKSENISIIHAHHRMAAFYTNIIPKARKCRKIATAHNTFYDKKLLTRFAYSNYLVVACGEKVKQNLCDYFNIPQERVEVVHNAVKPFNGVKSDYSLIKKYNNQNKIVNIGRLSEQKGFEYYIDAAKIILDKRKDFVFFIVGEGEEEAKLRNRVKDYGLDNYIIFVGYQSKAQDILSQMDLVVLSSLWEGFPLTPIEAFSVKKTIVATAVDGTVEIVKNGENGYLVKSKDSIQLAECILKIIDDKEKKSFFEENAYRLYCEEFSFSKLADSYISEYRKVSE